jgi:beta-lactam-binding protein with PASTA domain
VTDTDTDRWPTPDAETGVLHRERETLVGAPPPPVAPPPPAPLGPGPDRRIGAGMLLAIAAIALAVAGVAIAYFLTHRSSSQPPATTTVVRSTAPKPVAVKKVAVPRVVGLKEQPALLRLSQLGLQPKEVFRPSKQAKGIVLSQKPKEATEVKKGSQVTIVVDSGAPKVALPALTGKSLADAQAALAKLGLQSTRTDVTSSKPAGTIVDQAPPAGTKLAKGSMVTLSVAKAPAQATSTAPTTTGAQQTTTSAQQTTTAPTTTAAAPAQPQNATVPDVTNQTEQAAASALNSAGILASIAFVPSSDPLGTVEQQAKQAGTSVPYHSHMQINVSSGPGQKQTEQVPSVVGQTLQQAVSTLNGTNLRLIYVKYPVSVRSKAGKIVQQSPLDGGQVPQNAQVLVFVGAYQG